MAVVATTTSGVQAISSFVAASSSLSSASGTIRSAGACSTCAPRRRSSAMSSSARRAAVTPTVKPASGPVFVSSIVTCLVTHVGAVRVDRVCPHVVSDSVHLYFAPVTPT